METDILIIGSGAAGLTAALQLAQKHQVTVLAKGALSDGATAWAQGGIAAVGQLQLLQPFFGLALAATLLHEHVSVGMLAVTLGVILCVAGAKKFAK